MTPAQRILAREALGLPNRHGVSRRNFVGTYRSETDRAAALASMADERLARPTYDGKAVQYFTLTRAAAERAIEPGERLDPKHFPPLGQD